MPAPGGSTGSRIEQVAHLRNAKAMELPGRRSVKKIDAIINAVAEVSADLDEILKAVA